MKFKRELKIKQTGKQKMTPALIQSVKMLGLAAYDICELVRKELNENPVLEDTGDTGGKSSITDILEKTVARERTLTTHLLEQARISSESEDEYGLLELLISSLDESGFLAGEPESVAEDLKRNPEEVKEALKKINGFDPTGCGTAGTRESLMVQAEERYPGDLILREIIRTHLEDMGRGKYGKIARSLKTSQEAIQKRRELLKGLEPFPGKKFSPAGREYIIPDIHARFEKGKLVVELNETGIPELSINPFYTEMIKGKTGSEEKRYLNEKIESAKILIKGIERRRETLLLVAEEILDFQKGFILKGSGNLLPLLQKDVAERTGLNESTISRIVNKKYVDIPGRIVPLKSFFTRGVSTAGSDALRISTDRVRKKITEIIMSEDRMSPLKDGEIAGELLRSGLEISRRTVSKYRGILGIETAGRRKRGYGIKKPSA